MKKKYVKPLIQIESFQLDAAVAAGCEEKLWHAEYECIHEGDYFADQCEINLTTPDGNDQFCYHGPLITGGVEFLQS